MAIDTNSTIVDIVNAYQNLLVVSGKDSMVNAIGSPAVLTNTGDDLAGMIQTSKNTLVTNLSTLGISAVNTDTLSNLVGKVTKDANLVASNIISGTTIFGVTGSVAVGKRTQTGTGSSTNGVISVTGLPFTPTLVYVVMQSPTNVIAICSGKTSYVNSAVQMTEAAAQTASTMTTALTMNSTGFSGTFSGFSGYTYNYTWFACE